MFLQELVKITADDEGSEKEVPIVEDEDEDEDELSEEEPDCCEMTFKEKKVHEGYIISKNKFRYFFSDSLRILISNLLNRNH